MACAHVQTASATGEDVTNVTTPAITTTSGNLLHASLGMGDANFVDFTDSKTNTWLETRATATQGNTKGRMEHAVNISGGSGHTFNLEMDDNNFPTLAVHEISGAKLSDALGNTNGASSAGAGSLSSGTVAQSLDGEILCGMGVSFNGTGAWTNDADYTQRYNEPGVAVTTTGMIASTRESAVAETVDFTADPANSVVLIAMLASYKPVAAAYASGLMLTPGKFTWG